MVALAFVAVILEQQLWPHHGRAVGIGIAAVTLGLIAAADAFMGSNRRSVAGDLLIGKTVLVGLAGLVAALLLLSVTSLPGYLVLAIVLGFGVLLFGGTAVLDWWASRRDSA
jgi:hypothetical protein